MSKRSFTARQALAALLAAVCLPCVSVAKPPDLPATSKIECKEESTGKTLFGVGVNSDAGLTGSIVLSERNVDLHDVLRIFYRCEDSGVPGTVRLKVKSVEANGSIIFVPYNDVPDPLEDLVDLLRPRIEDLLESSWRTLSRWMPTSCAPNCCETPATRLAVIEVLSFAPKERELPFAQFMCLVEDHWELLPPPIRCGGSCPEQVPPVRVGSITKFDLPCCVEENLNRLVRAQQFCEYAEHCCKAGDTRMAAECLAEAMQLCPGSACAAACAARLRELIAEQAQTIVQTSAKEVKEDEKKSSWPRIEIKLTIEIKR